VTLGSGNRAGELLLPLAT